MNSIGSDLAQKLTRVLRWGMGAVAVALAVAGCGGGDAVNPTATAPARLDQVAALTQAQQSVNARIALPRMVALAAVSPGAATEDFESGMADWSNWGNAQVVAGAGTSGSSALQVGTGAGGAGLLVPGIVPGTAYRLTAQVKVSDPSETVFIGINMFSSTGSFVIGHSGPPVSGTGYATVTVDLVAPPNSANAVVWIWKNAGSGFGSMDDVSFGPASSAPPPPGPPASNLVSNGGFESGMADWVNWGNATVVSGQASSGTSALQVGTAAGGAGHDVNGIVPGTTYRLVAQAKVSDPSETVFVGVNLLNAAGAVVAQRALPTSSTSYSTLTLDVTAPADAVKAVVFAWKNDGSGFGYVDDIVFGDASGSAAPPPWRNLVTNGGFENGLANWVDWGNSTTTTAAAAGAAAAQVGTGAGGLGQFVGGVVPGATYRATAQVKMSIPIETVYFGLKFLDGAGNVLAEDFATFGSSAYLTAQLELAAPANASQALVYVWKNAGFGFASMDEVVLSQVTGALGSPLQVAATGAANGFVLQSAQLASGGHVVVWTSPTTPANPNPAVYAQLFDASGQKQGAPITVFAAPDGSALGIGFASTGVAGLPDGSFLVSAAGNGLSALFVQKVSGTGQLLPSGGVSDPGVNGGLADRLLLNTDINTLGFSGGPAFSGSPFFVNADGSYALAVSKTVRSAPLPFTLKLLLNVDSGGNVVGTPVDLSGTDYGSAPEVVRLGSGNFMVAGAQGSFVTSVPVKIVTNTGQEIGRQTLSPSQGLPFVTALADGTGLVNWFAFQPQPGRFVGTRIGPTGTLAGPASVPPQSGARVTGLAGGGYVATWTSGSQLLAQYFTTSGQVAGGAFVLVDNVDTSPSTPFYAISQTPDGFRVVYQGTTSAGPQIFEVGFPAPAL